VRNPAVLRNASRSGRPYARKKAPPCSERTLPLVREKGQTSLDCAVTKYLLSSVRVAQNRRNALALSVHFLGANRDILGREEIPCPDGEIR
jgi:hypothetical protein